MVIVHIVLGKANPNRMNGVNKVVYQLATNQALAGKSVEVWGITSDLSQNYGERNFKTVLFPKSNSTFGLSPELKQALINTEDAVFHLHGGWIPTFWQIVKILKANNKKIVLTPHGAYNSIAMQKSGLRKKIYFKLFEKQLLKNVDKIHCIGKSEKIGLNSIYQNQKQELIAYGFDQQVKQQNKKEQETFVIGFVGRIDIHTKGLDLITKAFCEFAEGKKTELWVIGDSDELPILKQNTSTLPNSNLIKFKGSKYGDEKDELIKQMSLFVHASRNEGLPTAVLEAASFGVPSVVSEATNVGDYITDYNAGICIPNENISELVQAFEKMYNGWEESSLHPMTEGAQEMLKKEFSWQSLIPKYDRLYA